MKFTFGIITAGDSRDNLEKVLASIEMQNIPDDCFEVIVVGGNEDYDSALLKLVSFDETQKKMWITRKKNIITERAKYENVVYFHDYVMLNPGWYDGFLRYGNDFQVCMTPIQNVGGSRFRDWTLCPGDIEHIVGDMKMCALLPYDVSDLSKHMYFSGAYWIAKKEVMQKYPLDEARGWADGEDVEWSQRVRQEYTFQLNLHSSVRLAKPKDPCFTLATPEVIKKLRDYAILQPK